MRILRKKISRIEPLNRSRRRQSALILCLESKHVRRLKSAATRFMGSFPRFSNRGSFGRPLPLGGGEGRAEGAVDRRSLDGSKIAHRDHEPNRSRARPRPRDQEDEARQFLICVVLQK